MLLVQPTVKYDWVSSIKWPTQQTRKVISELTVSQARNCTGKDNQIQ